MPATMNPPSTRITGPRDHDPVPTEAWPFESRFLELDGHRLHHIDEGHGPTLLFVHAGPAWSVMWKEVILELRDAYRCVAIDLPAVGPSQAAPGFTHDIESNARVLAETVDALDLAGTTPVVHDLGGAVTFRAATEHPDLFPALVICDTFGWPLDEYPKVTRMLRFASGHLFGALNWSLDLLPRLMPGPGTPLREHTKAEKRAWRAPTQARANRNRYRSLFRDATESSQLLAEVEAGLEEHYAGRPVLLFYGEEDPIRAFAWDERFSRMFPQAPLHVIDGAMHFAPVDAPGQLAAAIRTWWKASQPAHG